LAIPVIHMICTIYVNNFVLLSEISKSLYCLTKSLIPPFQILLFWPIGLRIGEDYVGIMESLETMQKHGAVFFVKHIFSNFNNKIRCHSDNEFVKGCMMELAQCDTVLNNWSAVRLCIRNDLSSIQQFSMSQSAKRTTVSVCR
jgi:hypothetical protein